MTVPQLLAGASAVSDMIGGLWGAKAAEERALKEAAAMRKAAKVAGEFSDWEVALMEAAIDSELAIADFGAAVDIQRQKRERVLLEGSATAGIGKAGVAFEGSPQAAMDNMLAQYEKDVVIQRFNRAVEREAMATGADLAMATKKIQTNIQQQSLLTKARGLEAEARDIKTAGRIGVGTSLLRGVTDVQKVTPEGWWDKHKNWGK